MTIPPLQSLPQGFAWTTWSIGHLCAFFLQFLTHFQIRSPHHLLHALERQKSTGQPLLTFSNHISTLDDPLIWGWLPPALFAEPERMRWALAAQEILFHHSKYISSFFLSGQVLPIVRGAGLEQNTMRLAHSILQTGRWLHVFPEARVSPTPATLLLPLRWGMAHLIMQYYESNQATPMLLPIALKGMDRVMPLHARLPVPRPFQSVTMAVGSPITDIQPSYLASLYHRYQGNAAAIRSELTHRLAMHLVRLHADLYSFPSQQDKDIL